MAHRANIEIELNTDDRTIVVDCCWCENERGAGWGIEIAVDKDSNEIVHLSPAQEYEAQVAAGLKDRNSETMDFECMDD